MPRLKKKSRGGIGERVKELAPELSLVVFARDVPLPIPLETLNELLDRLRNASHSHASNVSLEQPVVKSSVAGRGRRNTVYGTQGSEQNERREAKRRIHPFADCREFVVVRAIHRT
jgi:hypothetical protein